MSCLEDYLECLVDSDGSELNLAIGGYVKFNYTVNNNTYLLRGIIEPNGRVSHIQIRDPFWKSMITYLSDHSADEQNIMSIEDWYRYCKDITIFNLLDDECFEILPNRFNSDERACIEATIESLQGLLDE
jgi:hypothetical protein